MDRDSKKVHSLREIELFQQNRKDKISKEPTGLLACMGAFE